MIRVALRAAIVLACAFVAGLVVFSNHHDWNAFYALSEVDRRSWLVDHELPLWTYQLCAGTSRIADPQAFGLSPFFVLVLAFGSVWGVKLQVLVSWALGLFFTARTFELCHRSETGPGWPRAEYVALAMLFVCGNYFVWHLLVGHMTFSVMLLGLGIVYFTLKGYTEGLSGRDLAAGVLLAWQHYSSGFYHSVVYLLIPFFLAFGLFVAIDGLRRAGHARPFVHRFAGAAGFHLIGIVLAAYKVLPVWWYSREVRRRLGVLHESLSPAQVAFQLLAPTWDRRFLLDFDAGNLWDVHEYSAFSLVVPLLLGVAVLVLAKGRGRSPCPQRGPLGLLAGLYLAVAGCFALGDFAPLSPYGLVNRFLLGGEARVVGRFNVGVVLAAGMLMMLMLRPPHRWRWMGSATCVALLAALLLNLCSFLTLTSARQLERVLAYPSRPHAPLQGWRSIEVYQGRWTRGYELDPRNTVDMYRHVLEGEGLYHCYNALPRKIRPVPGRFVPLVDPVVGAPGNDCLERSRYTQNRILLSESCPARVCVNAASINPQEAMSFAPGPHGMGYCRLAVEPGRMAAPAAGSGGSGPARRRRADR